MSLVTSVTGNSSLKPATLRSFSGNFKAARGHSRCSECTPTAWVGTRINPLGCGSRSNGITRNLGAGGTFDGIPGRAAGLEAACGVGPDCFGRLSQAIARLLAPISPSVRCNNRKPLRWFYYSNSLSREDVGVPKCHYLGCMSTCGKFRECLKMKHLVMVLLRLLPARLNIERQSPISHARFAVRNRIARFRHPR